MKEGMEGVEGDMPLTAPVLVPIEPPSPFASPATVDIPGLVPPPPPRVPPQGAA